MRTAIVAKSSDSKIMIWKRVQALVKVFNVEHSQFLSVFMYYDADLATTCVNEIADNEKLIEL